MLQQPPLKDLKIGALAKTGDECFLVVDPLIGEVLMLDQAFVSYLPPETPISHYGKGKPHNPDSDHIPHLSDRIKWLEFK